jgi:AcrR family transcriptional regulator
MTTSVTSPLCSPQARRCEHATKTREAVARAARPLFVRDGYTRTTMEAIAHASGRSPATIYAIFGSKSAILVEVRRLWFRDADLNELVQDALDEPQARPRLALVARWIRHQLETGADLTSLIDEAVRTDRKVAAQWSRLRVFADETLRQVLAGIAGQLRTSITLNDAVDIVWALSRAAVFAELTTRGWTADRYESWLSAVLQQQLLTPTAFTTALTH